MTEEDDDRCLMKLDLDPLDLSNPANLQPFLKKEKKRTIFIYQQTACEKDKVEDQKKKVYKLKRRLLLVASESDDSLTTLLAMNLIFSLGMLVTAKLYLLVGGCLAAKIWHLVQDTHGILLILKK